MAIGKLLQVRERLGVEQPVLSPQTQALSSNVAAQKIQFADYRIGMNNSKASFAVSEELVKMVDAGVKAKMYIDNTKQDYQRLNLMEEWQKSDMDYKAQFAQAMTPEAQEAVIADYDSSLQKRTGDWRKSMGNDVESQKYLSSLRSGSQKQFSTFSTTHSQTLFKRTSGLHANTIERVAKALSEDKNADVVSGFKTIQDTTASLVGMGAIEPEIAQFNLSNLKDKIVTGRSALFAQDFAKNATTTGHYPTDKEFKAQMEGVMGMELGERRLKLLQESFEDSYFKEIGERNRQVKAEETYALEVTEAGRLDLKDRVNKAIQDKTIAPELKEKLIKEAHTFDYAVKGFGASIEKKIRESEYGTSYKPFVEHFTIGDGRKFILENIKADGTSYFNLDELRGHLETMGGKYEGMNESTIREVLTHWRGINDSTRKGLADQGEEVMQVALMSMLKTDQSQVPEWLQEGTMKQLGVASSMLTKMKDPMHLNWSKTMRYSPAHAKAWNVTLSDIKAQFDSKQGVFSKENISQPADVQRSMLENYVGKLLEKNFSESVNEELARLDNEKLKKREKLETEERNRKAKVQQELPTFAMEKIGDGVSLDKPASKEVPPAVKLIEHQMSKKRIRNAQYASTFKDQLNKGEFGSAVGTAVASKWTDITQAIRDAHEQSKQTYNKSSLNDRSQHLKDMAVMTKKVKKTVASGIWAKLAKAVGQGEEITMEGFANDMGMLTGAVGDLLIDGVENHNIEKTPITNTKRTTVKTPDPLATPPKTQPTESPNVAQDVPDSIRKAVVENPIIGNLVGTISDLVTPATADAASTFQDPNFDPAAPTGVRAFTGPASKDLAVKPEGAKGATGEYPQYGEQYVGGTSEESDIEGFVEDTVDMPPVVMDEIVMSAPREGDQLKDLPIELQKEIKRQQDGKLMPASPDFDKSDASVGLLEKQIETFKSLESLIGNPSDKGSLVMEETSGRMFSRMYPERAGKETIPTIGIGFNLKKPGAKTRIEALGYDYEKVLSGKQSITRTDINTLFIDDIAIAKQEANKIFNLDSLPKNVASVVVKMLFQLGDKRFRKFEDMIKAIKNKKYDQAAKEILTTTKKNGKVVRSSFHQQVPGRARRLAEQMRQAVSSQHIGGAVTEGK